MPVIIKKTKKDSAASLMRKFKKITTYMNIVQDARDKRYYKKPSTIKAEKNSEKRHLKKKLKTLKKMKNISPQSLERLRDKINRL
jgi:ribosomal protein S21